MTFVIPNTSTAITIPDFLLRFILSNATCIQDPGDAPQSILIK